VSDVDDRLPLFLPSDPANRVGSSLIEDHWDWRGYVDVDTVRLDTYCARHGVDRIDLIRIDAEGAESKVLLGMGSLLNDWLPDIICEVMNPPDDSLQRLIAETPYRIFLIIDGGLQEVNEIRPHPHFRDYYLSCDPITL
jgi:hypothetical protein